MITAQCLQIVDHEPDVNHFAMMTSDDFKALSYTQKTEAILTGIFLAARSNERHYIKLYNVDNFYVEVFIDSRSQLIIHFRAFDHTLFVLPYLEELKIAI